MICRRDQRRLLHLMVVPIYLYQEALVVKVPRAAAIGEGELDVDVVTLLVKEAQGMMRASDSGTNAHVVQVFGIVQGGLDVSPGGLRDVCLEGMLQRDASLPGYAIGGLSGGESKDQFWRVVEQVGGSAGAPWQP